MDDKAGLSEAISDSLPHGSGEEALLPATRHAKMLGRLEERGQMTVSQFALSLNVSVDTVRRDLVQLENRGLITRTYGGAVLNRGAAEHAGQSQAIGGAVAIHQRIAHRAAELIADGETLAINSGLINTCFASMLGERRGLTVMTNNIGFASTIPPASFSSLHILGGTYIPASNATVGPVQFADVPDIQADTAILCVSGLSSSGLSMTRLDEAAVAAAMVRMAKRTIVLAPQSQFDITAFAKVAIWSQVSMLVTDQRPTGAIASTISKAGCDIRLA